MTSLQLSNLNTNLKPIALSNIEELKTNHTIRNQLVLFFYKLKRNYDNNEKGKDVCPVLITWDILNTSEPNVLNFSTGDSISGILAVKLYKYIFMQNNKTDYISYTIEALRLDNLFKKQAYRYFKGKKCCDVQKISNYNKYYFMQDCKFIGNK